MKKRWILLNLSAFVFSSIAITSCNSKTEENKKIHSDSEGGEFRYTTEPLVDDWNPDIHTFNNQNLKNIEKLKNIFGIDLTNSDTFENKNLFLSDKQHNIYFNNEYINHSNKEKEEFLEFSKNSENALFSIENNLNISNFENYNFALSVKLLNYKNFRYDINLLPSILSEAVLINFYVKAPSDFNQENIKKSGLNIDVSDKKDSLSLGTIVKNNSLDYDVLKRIYPMFNSIYFDYNNKTLHMNFRLEKSKERKTDFKFLKQTKLNNSYKILQFSFMVPINSMDLKDFNSISDLEVKINNWEQIFTK
ncbi:hypothetical protein [Mycoplasma sp. Z386]